ncbi:MAG: hypothetical protein LUJ25_09170 [Firmicutes bacterium]|nr:hypothetical protein [Bacillota bacterium]
MEDGRVVETTHRLRGGLDAGFMMNGVRYTHQKLQHPAVLEKLAKRYPSLFIHRSVVIDVLDAIPGPPEEDDEEGGEEDNEESDSEEEEEGDDEEVSTILTNETNGNKEEESEESNPSNAENSL